MPFRFCHNFDPVFPGNIGVGSADAWGFRGPDFRANIFSHNINPFWAPSVGADLLINPAMAEAQSFDRSEHVEREHRAPKELPNYRTSRNSGSGGNFANLGDFFMDVGPPPGPGQRPALLPITWFKYNPAFGQPIQSFDREGVSASGEIRLGARIVRLGVARQNRR